MINQDDHKFVPLENNPDEEMPPNSEGVVIGNPREFPVESTAHSPPTGVWKDSLFDCFKNLWPSLACMCLCSGIWLIAQSL